MGCNDKNDFVELYNRVYPEVEKIVRRYDGMLISQRLQDSIECDLYHYKQFFMHQYYTEERQLDRVIKSCYRDAVQKLEEENSKYSEDFENSFVCQSLKEIIKTKEKQRGIITNGVPSIDESIIVDAWVSLNNEE